MSLAGLVDRYGRAIVLAVTLLAGAGLIAGSGLPSSIYPRLEFPRVVIIGHSGTLPARAMMLSVTTPARAGGDGGAGIRRVRSTTFRGATEISAQFEPSTDMVVALQQVQGKIDDARPTLPDGHRPDRRTPDAGGVPDVHPQPDAARLLPPSFTTTRFYVMRPRLARVAGAGQVEVSASDTREIEVVTDPARLLCSGPDGPRRRREAEGRKRSLRRSAGIRLAAFSSWSSRPGCGRRFEEIGETPIAVQARWRAAGEGCRAGVSRCSRIARASSPATVETRRASAFRSRWARTSSTSKPACRKPSTSSHARLPAGLHITKVYDLAEFVRAAIANVRDAILIGGLLAVIILLLFLRDWRLTLDCRQSRCRWRSSITFVVMRLFGESDQPDVDGRPRCGDWPRHRRCRRRRGGHPSARAGRIDDAGCGRDRAISRPRL